MVRWVLHISSPRAHHWILCLWGAIDGHRLHSVSLEKILGVQNLMGLECQHCGGKKIVTADGIILSCDVCGWYWIEVPKFIKPVVPLRERGDSRRNHQSHQKAVSSNCPRCGKPDCWPKINAKVCSGCLWSFDVCKCSPKMTEI